MSVQGLNNSLHTHTLAAPHLIGGQTQPPVTNPPSVDTLSSTDNYSKGVCDYLKHIFTVFCNAMKKLWASIVAFFQGGSKPETQDPLKTKPIEVIVQPEPLKLPTPTPQPVTPNPLKTNTIDVIKQPTPAPQPQTSEAPTQPRAPLTAHEREHRVRKGAQEIQERLAREWQHVQNQMARESDKEFVYEEAPANFNKLAHEEQIDKYQVGICHYIGGRPTMEDEHVATVFELNIAGNVYKIPLFAVMDGHGGVLCAQFVRDNLQQTLRDTLLEFNPQKLTDEGIWNALKHVGVRLHERFCAQYYNGKTQKEQDESGTTLVFSMILDGKVYTANIGDSRAVINNNGEALQLSEDAKPHDPNKGTEEERRYNKGITNRGGQVQWNGCWRINARLGCARSIGDAHLNGANSARPKITVRALNSLAPGSFLTLGCDGIYDVSSTRQIVKAIHEHNNLGLGKLAKNIIYSTAKSGSRDNQSFMIIKLK